MARSITYYKWLDAGYDLFAKEGPESLHVEKLARILELNKSGFYHYFGDMENFSERLIKHHEHKYDLMLVDIPACRNFDPDFLNVMLKHKFTILVQMHMVRCTNGIFAGAYKNQDGKVRDVLMNDNVWSHHINIDDNPEFSIIFFNMVRDMFYTRISLDNFNYEYLHKLSDEISYTVKNMLDEKEKVEIKKKEEN